MANKYDAIIIGTGQSGPALAGRLNEEGMKTAIVERKNEVRASGRRALVGKRMMTRVSREREFGDTRRIIKIIVDADSEEILGAAILGLNGDEAIHCLLDVMYARKPYTVISRAVHIHPTVSELIPTVLQEMVALE